MQNVCLDKSVAEPLPLFLSRSLPTECDAFLTSGFTCVDGSSIGVGRADGISANVADVPRTS